MGGAVEFGNYRRQMARAAKELCYGQNVVERVKNAKTVGEIEHIMRNARHGKICEDLKTGNSIVIPDENADKKDRYSRKLTKEDVAYIKKNYIKRSVDFGVSAMAKKFNITTMCVYDIINGRTWKSA